MASDPNLAILSEARLLAVTPEVVGRERLAKFASVPQGPLSEIAGAPGPLHAPRSERPGSFFSRVCPECGNESRAARRACAWCEGHGFVREAR
ncbi:MAG TPA: hypothetical protein VFN61_01925 [Acidimicrobiales bacterium]|nr:hypothetical protein [Acidimicrobiales bacterium]